MTRSFSRLLGSVLILLALVGCARHVATSLATPTPPPRPTPPPVYSLLDGLQVAPKSGRHRIAAVMIDNYPIDARPQSGLREADLVYEVEAEGGITRYMALFLENDAREIGPVRSARTYFVDLARPYEPLFAHAGENDDVWEPLKELRLAGFADMEQILGTPEAFWRDNSRDMPHNLYTSTSRLRTTAARYGYADKPLTSEEFAFAPDPDENLQTPSPNADPADPPPSGASPVPSPTKPQLPEAIVTFWNDYTVRFHPTDTGYERIIDNVVQHDRDDPRPYLVADVIAVWIPARVLDVIGDLSMDVYGTFPAVLVRDGHATPATWFAPGPTMMPQLLDKSGDNVPLAPGQIYVEVLPQGGTLRVGKNIWSH
ncbi:MAG: DUF3048 domain-containing protein [Candidatus Eremiobacteraeota bacterium]|nr:DUF3048 domain-containing protein [Candidatus Eremiobacteraeota bacterium]